MQDAAVVAAIVAGNPDGFAAAYDQYAAPLYAYCSFMLPSPDEAADAVRDIFLIATSQLPKLRDPGKLRPWLHAVARNECLRRRSAAGITSQPPKTPGGVLPAIELPAALRGEVLAACADNTPAGRADRATVAHRAGTFGPSGFPKAVGSSAPQWWQRLRRRPRIAAAVVTVAVAAVVGALLATVTIAGPHRAQASIVANGSKVSGGSHVASGTPEASAQATASSSEHPQVSPGPGQPTPSVTALGGVTSPASVASPGMSKPAATPSGTSASPSSSASASASASAAPPPAPGTLQATPVKLALSSTSGKATSGTFLLSAVGGPVGKYVITVPAGVASKVKVSPAKGAISSGGWVTITVTVTSKTALSTSLTINPGKLAVTVALSIKR